MKQQRVMAANANRIRGVKSTYNKIIGSKAFTLKAQANGAELFFTSSDAEVATVDSKTGLVTIVGMGRTVITITSQPSKKYKAASKTVILNVKPKKMQVKSAETLKKRNLTYRWEKHLGVSGYHIQLNPIALTNPANVKQPFSTRAGDAILDARATIVKTPDRARSNSDILPTVSIDVWTSQSFSSADIPTRSTPSAPTIPAIIHILLITPD